jgi:hypothetical protein
MILVATAVLCFDFLQICDNLLCLAYQDITEKSSSSLPMMQLCIFRSVLLWKFIVIPTTNYSLLLLESLAVLNPVKKHI